MIKFASLPILGLVVTLLLMSPVQAQDDADQDAEAIEPLQVAVRVIEPFIMATDNSYTGFSAEIWEAVARHAELPFEYVEVETVTDQIEAVESGEADVAIAAISMTREREERIDFAHPYFDSGLGILVPAQPKINLAALLQSEAAGRLIRVMGVFLVVILIVSHVTWLLERHHNPEFPRGYLAGIWESIWWTTVTATTVGYGDKTPHTVPGRAIGILWMLGGLFLIAYFTAEVTSAFTLQGLRGGITEVADLPGYRVVTVAGSTADDYLADLNLRHVTVEDVEVAFRQVESDRADAIVYDAPILMYYANTEATIRFELIGDLLSEEDYGIALPENSPHRDNINRALLGIQSDGTYDRIYANWFE